MKAKITAFVGHSFDDKDESLIRQFKDYFDTLKAMGDWFDWDHAEKAEPRVLSEKVREKMEGKNLFIGIFTVKNKEIEAAKLIKKGWFDRNKIITSESDYHWNASDWIIQESGYALGKNMKLIFLKEDGLLSIGGLQGDQEYIGFSRGNPSQCFQKILEMIGTLTPKAKITEINAVVNESKPKEMDEIEKPESSTVEKKETEWTALDYRYALFRAIMTNDEKKEQEIYEKYLQIIDKNNIDEIVDWKARRLYFKSMHRPSNELEQMKKLSCDYPENSEVRFFIGNILMRFNNYDDASEEFKLSAMKTTDPHLKIIRMCHAAEAKADAGKFEEATSIIATILQIVTDIEDADYSTVLKALSHIALKKNDTEEYTAFCEAALTIKPDNHDLRFSLAYKYAELEKHKMALYHYKILTDSVPNEANCNNIGVTYDRLQLNGKSVSAYNKSQELGGTLAMSNLAKKLIVAGFLDKAQEICDMAVKIKDYDQRVGEAISRISSVKDEEMLKEEEFLESIKESRMFSIEFGKAYRPGETIDLPSKWKSPLCEFEVKVQDGIFSAKGEYKKSETSMGFIALLSSPKKLSEPRYLHSVVIYKGSINGRAIEYKLCITTTELNDASKPPQLVEKKGLMTILKDKTKIIVLEKDKDKKEEMYTLVPLS